MPMDRRIDLTGQGINFILRFIDQASPSLKQFETNYQSMLNSIDAMLRRTRTLLKTTTRLMDQFQRDVQKANTILNPWSRDRRQIDDVEKLSKVMEKFFKMANQGLGTLRQEMSSFNREAPNMKRNEEDIAKGAEEMANKLGKAEKEMGIVESVLARGGAWLAGLGLAQLARTQEEMAMQLIGSIETTRTLYQKQRKDIKGVSDSIKDATVSSQDLYKISEKTAVPIDNLKDSYREIISMGMEWGKQSKETLTTAAQVAEMIGSPEAVTDLTHRFVVLQQTFGVAEKDARKFLNSLTSGILAAAEAGGAPIEAQINSITQTMAVGLKSYQGYLEDTGKSHEEATQKMLERSAYIQTQFGQLRKRGIEDADKMYASMYAALAQPLDPATVNFEQMLTGFFNQFDKQAGQQVESTFQDMQAEAAKLQKQGVLAPLIDPQPLIEQVLAGVSKMSEAQLRTFGPLFSQQMGPVMGMSPDQFFDMIRKLHGLSIESLRSISTEAAKTARAGELMRQKWDELSMSSKKAHDTFFNNLKLFGTAVGHTWVRLVTPLLVVLNSVAKKFLSWMGVDTTKSDRSYSQVDRVNAEISKLRMKETKDPKIRDIIQNKIEKYEKRAETAEATGDLRQQREMYKAQTPPPQGKPTTGQQFLNQLQLPGVGPAMEWWQQESPFDKGGDIIGAGMAAAGAYIGTRAIRAGRGLRRTGRNIADAARKLAGEGATKTAGGEFAEDFAQAAPQAVPKTVGEVVKEAAQAPKTVTSTLEAAAAKEIPAVLEGGEGFLAKMGQVLAKAPGLRGAGKFLGPAGLVAGTALDVAGGEKVGRAVAGTAGAAVGGTAGAALGGGTPLSLPLAVVGSMVGNTVGKAMYDVGDWLVDAVSNAFKGKDPGKAAGPMASVEKILHMQFRVLEHINHTTMRIYQALRHTGRHPLVETREGKEKPQQPAGITDFLNKKADGATLEKQEVSAPKVPQIAATLSDDSVQRLADIIEKSIRLQSDRSDGKRDTPAFGPVSRPDSDKVKIDDSAMVSTMQQLGMGMVNEMRQLRQELGRRYDISPLDDLYIRYGQNN